MEILLIPIACFAIIPIGVSAFKLSSSYLRAGACMRAHLREDDRLEMLGSRIQRDELL